MLGIHAETFAKRRSRRAFSLFSEKRVPHSEYVEEVALRVRPHIQCLAFHPFFSRSLNF